MQCAHLTFARTDSNLCGFAHIARFPGWGMGGRVNQLTIASLLEPQLPGRHFTLKTLRTLNATCTSFARSLNVPLASTVQCAHLTFARTDSNLCGFAHIARFPGSFPPLGPGAKRASGLPCASAWCQISCDHLPGNSSCRFSCFPNICLKARAGPTTPSLDQRGILELCPKCTSSAEPQGVRP